MWSEGEAYGSSPVKVYWEEAPSRQVLQRLAAATFDDYSADEIKEALLGGTMHCIKFRDVYILLGEVYVNRRRVLYIYAVHGTVSDFSEAYDFMVRYATSENYDSIDSQGRPGWAKKYPQARRYLRLRHDIPRGHGNERAL